MRVEAAKKTTEYNFEVSPHQNETTAKLYLDKICELFDKAKDGSSLSKDELTILEDINSFFINMCKNSGLEQIDNYKMIPIIVFQLTYHKQISKIDHQAIHRIRELSWSNFKEDHQYKLDFDVCDPKSRRTKKEQSVILKYGLQLTLARKNKSTKEQERIAIEQKAFMAEIKNREFKRLEMLNTIKNQRSGTNEQHKK